MRKRRLHSGAGRSPRAPIGWRRPGPASRAPPLGPRLFPHPPGGVAETPPPPPPPLRAARRPPPQPPPPASGLPRGIRLQPHWRARPGAGHLPAAAATRGRLPALPAGLQAAFPTQDPAAAGAAWSPQAQEPPADTVPGPEGEASAGRGDDAASAPGCSRSRIQWWSFLSFRVKHI